MSLAPSLGHRETKGFHGYAVQAGGLTERGGTWEVPCALTGPVPGRRVITATLTNDGDEIFASATCQGDDKSGSGTWPDASLSWCLRASAQSIRTQRRKPFGALLAGLGPTVAGCYLGRAGLRELFLPYPSVSQGSSSFSPGLPWSCLFRAEVPLGCHKQANALVLFYTSAGR